MAQYCRYCGDCVVGDVVYCEAYEKEMTEKKAKRANKCRAFNLNPVDAFGENKRGYVPRKATGNIEDQIRLDFENVPDRWKNRM